MTQLHRRFTDDQVKVLLKGYCQELLKGAEVQDMLGMGGAAPHQDLPRNSSPLSTVKTIPKVTPCDRSQETAQGQKHRALVKIPPGE